MTATLAPPVNEFEKIDILISKHFHGTLIEPELKELLNKLENFYTIMRPSC